MTEALLGYGPLGPPPRQPRVSRFNPRSGRTGKGTLAKWEQMEGTEDALIVLNRDLLRRYDLGRLTCEASHKPSAPPVINGLPSNGEGGDEAARMVSEVAAASSLSTSSTTLISTSSSSFSSDTTVARGAVRAGDIILAAKPFVHVLSTSSRNKRCEGCFQKAPIKVVCASCQYAYYCSAACKERDRVMHDDECLYFTRRKKPPSSDTARFILRIILKMRSGGHRLADVVPGVDKPRTFRDLLDHFDDILQSNRADMANAYYEEILRIMGVEEAPDPDYFLECYGRMAVNSFHILDENLEAIGTALYLGPSIMDHSCVPNASVAFDGINIVVRSLIDRSHVDFSTVLISYIDVMNPRKHRREHLFRHYYFLCDCPRCSNAYLERDMFCVACPSCTHDVFLGDGEHIADEAEPCPGCDQTIDDHSLSKYADTCAMVAQKLNSLQMSSDEAELCLRFMAQSRFSQMHIYVIKSTEVIFENLLCDLERLHADSATGDGAEDDDLLEKALFHGHNLLHGYSKYASHVWLYEGLYLLKVAELEFVLGNNQDCERHLKRARDIIKVAVGDSGSTHLSRIYKLLSLLSTS